MIASFGEQYSGTRHCWTRVVNHGWHG